MEIVKSEGRTEGSWFRLPSLLTFVSALSPQPLEGGVTMVTKWLQGLWHGEGQTESSSRRHRLISDPETGCGFFFPLSAVYPKPKNASEALSGEPSKHANKKELGLYCRPKCAWEVETDIVRQAKAKALLPACRRNPGLQYCILPRATEQTGLWRFTGLFSPRVVSPGCHSPPPYTFSGLAT